MDFFLYLQQLPTLLDWFKDRDELHEVECSLQRVSFDILWGNAFILLAEIVDFLFHHLFHEIDQFAS